MGKPGKSKKLLMFSDLPHVHRTGRDRGCVLRTCNYPLTLPHDNGMWPRGQKGIKREGLKARISLEALSGRQIRAHVPLPIKSKSVKVWISAYVL